MLFKRRGTVTEVCLCGLWRWHSLRKGIWRDLTLPILITLENVAGRRWLWSFNSDNQRVDLCMEGKWWSSCITHVTWEVLKTPINCSCNRRGELLIIHCSLPQCIFEWNHVQICSLPSVTFVLDSISDIFTGDAIVDVILFQYWPLCQNVCSEFMSYIVHCIGDGSFGPNRINCSTYKYEWFSLLYCASLNFEDNTFLYLIITITMLLHS